MNENYEKPRYKQISVFYVKYENCDQTHSCIRVNSSTDKLSLSSIIATINT